MNDKELNQKIIDDLLSIPDELREAEIIIAKAQQSLDQKKGIVADAEFDAELNAVIDGKNAEERKRQLKQAITESSAVQLAQTELFAQEAELIELEANVKAIARRFRANLALSELQAARMYLLAKYPKSSN